MGAVVQPLRPLKTFSPIEWEGLSAPEPDWLIDGVVLRKTVCLFSGPGETGKSMLMQQLMTACATGRPWLGMNVPRCRTFGLFAEDPRAVLWRRQEGINRHYGASHGDLEDMDLISIDEVDDFALYRPTKESPSGRPTLLWSQITNRIQDFGAELVVIDNVGAIFEANENYKEHVRPFMTLVIKLARDINGAVMLIQHPSAAGENDGSAQSGARIWRSSVRAQMILGRIPEEDPENPSDERVIRFGKANYGRRKAGMRIEWRDGMFVPCTISDEKGGLSPMDWAELKYKIDRELGHRITTANERFTMAKTTKFNVATQLRHEKSWHRYAWKEIMDACESMLRDGKLVTVDVGPASRRETLLRPKSVTYAAERTRKEAE